MRRMFVGRCIVAAAVAIGIETGAPTARAQLAVLDSANLEQTSQNLAGTLRLLDQAKQTVSELTSVASVLGTAGAGSGGLSSPLRSLGASMALPLPNLD